MEYLKLISFITLLSMKLTSSTVQLSITGVYLTAVILISSWPTTATPTSLFHILLCVAENKQKSVTDISIYFPLQIYDRMQKTHLYQMGMKFRQDSEFP